jgi:hypothetical protein
VGHHRFKVTLEITVAESGAPSTPDSGSDPAITEDLTKAIKRLKPKKGGTEYTVEQVKEVR